MIKVDLVSLPHLLPITSINFAPTYSILRYFSFALYSRIHKIWAISFHIQHFVQGLVKRKYARWIFYKKSTEKIYFVRHLWGRETIESCAIATPSDVDAKKPRQAFPVSTMGVNYKKSCCVGGKWNLLWTPYQKSKKRKEGKYLRERRGTQDTKKYIPNRLVLTHLSLSQFGFEILASYVVSLVSQKHIKCMSQKSPGYRFISGL